MKRYLFIIATWCVAISALATEKTILSPGEKVKVTLSDAGGRPTYTVADRKSVV